MKKYLFLTVWFSILWAQQTPSYESQGDSQEHWITIFVHGILSVKPYLNFTNITRFMKDDIANSSYERCIEKIRKEPYFHQHHPMQALGLHKIDCAIGTPGATASCFAGLYDYIWQLNAHKDAYNEYYTFGWSGLLSSKMRSLESEVFYHNLKTLLEDYHAQGKNPKVRIIGYSHGGNVVLGLAMVDLQQGDFGKIAINELILLGMPVIQETDHLINHPMFEKIYHFYSPADRVQRIDLFSSKRLLSQRIFKSRSDFQIPQKLHQVELRLTRLTKRVGNKNMVTASSHNWKQRNGLIRKADPGHSELWSFGWTPGSYRKHLPIYPLPVATFLGYLINSLHHYSVVHPHIIMDIRPFNQSLYIIQDSKATIAPFLTAEQMNYLKNTASQWIPSDYSSATFNQRMNALIKETENMALSQNMPQL